MNGLTAKNSKFTLALGAVSCTVRPELLPYETYDMRTRILTWDEKWVYMVTHFVKQGARIDPIEVTLYPKQKKEASRKSSVSSEASSHETSTKNQSPAQNNRAVTHARSVRFTAATKRRAVNGSRQRCRRRQYTATGLETQQPEQLDLGSNGGGKMQSIKARAAPS